MKMKNGVVIDHIEAGRGIIICRMLSISAHNFPIAANFNLPSYKMRKKDLVKMENKTLTADDENRLALIAPDCTVSLIENGGVVRKYKLPVPQFVNGYFTCANPRCVSLHENIEPRFEVVDSDLKCLYCKKLTLFSTKAITCLL
jgi:aspartate carbamoyltransferase regulatory subunit